MNIFCHATYVGTTGYNAHSQNFFRSLSRYHDLKIRNFTVGQDWRGIHMTEEECHGKDVTELDKKLLGLQTLWNLNHQLEDFPLYGFKKEEYKYDLNLILAECNHYYFYHDYVGPKIAYTVWETTRYFEPFFEKLKEYDQVWVPTKWQADVTINQGMDPKKVKVVPEGVDSSLFYPEDVKVAGGKFRFLIFGRWDVRKSTVELIRAFKNVFENNPKVELVISVEDKFNFDGLGSTKERLKEYGLMCDNIRILNFPSREEYAKFLKAGHVYLSCSRSEGWNLPLIEAMACGTPSLYSDCSGQLEFASGKGIPIKVKGEIHTSNFYKNGETCSGNWYDPDFKDLEDKMIEVYNNYEYYKKKALEDSVIIREKFSWDNAAKKACSILDDFTSANRKNLQQTDPQTWDEIVVRNTYEKYVSVDQGDTVLDLGCSKGFFYFKHKNKNIKYIGVDASQDCLSDFYSHLNVEDNPVILNAFISNDKKVHYVKPFFHNTPDRLVSCLSFDNLMSLIPDKINFLKFDIEGAEKLIFGCDKSRKLIKEKVEKFSGEVHFNTSLFQRQEVYDAIKKLQSDPDFEIRLHSVDGFHIDNNFWREPDRFTEIIISGSVKKNGKIKTFSFTPNKSEDNNAINIVNESPSLGDIIAWMPMVDKFQKEKGLPVNLFTPFGELFQSRYPNINFDYYNRQPQNQDKVIHLGTYEFIEGKRWSEYNLQEMAAKILGISFHEIKAKIAKPNVVKNNFDKKYVCIATQSTAQFKYWNNPSGWSQTVEYLKSLGLEVVCIDKHPVFGVDGSMNQIPPGCIDKTGEHSLEDRINDIMHCEFFIGLTSGLSWLAWALNKPVVFISGISLPRTDFHTPYRVTNTNQNICHGCASEPDFIFDKNDWLFCPKKKSFQCTKEISFEMVKDKIDLLISNENIDLDVKLINAKISFLESPHIEIFETRYPRYMVQLFHFHDNQWVIYHEEHNAPQNYNFKFFASNRQKWKVRIYAFENEKIKLVFQETYDEKNKNILFRFDSESSEVEKIYLKKVLEFEKENQCRAVVASKHHEKLKKAFPNFERIYPFETKFGNIYASYNIKRHEIETKKTSVFGSDKLWMNRGRADITVDHHENWVEYKQEDIFDDIINNL
jgi:autotransporter strand-loop-strand O-heptosyltransferase